MIGNFNDEAQEILNKAKLEMLELRHPYIGTEHLTLAILNAQNDLTKELKEYGLTYKIFKNKLINIIGTGNKKSDFFLHTPLLKKVIENAIMDSKDNNKGIVTPYHLFGAILEVGDGIAIRILISMNIDLDKLYDEFSQKIWKPQKNAKKLLLEEIGVDINDKVKKKEIDPVVGRDEEINSIEEILLRRTKNNPLLIGEPGVGKTAIVEGLATLIEYKEVPLKLQNKRIISLDMASAVAGTKYRGEFEEKIKRIIKEIEENQDIILFIDEIHTLIGAGGAEGAIDASNILKPALARGKIHCIGATTIDEYKKHFEKDKALERRFQIINIKEPTKEETKNILYKIKPIYEKFHNVKIDNIIIDQIITLSEKYIYEKYRPDKQIDILDEVCSNVNIKKQQNNKQKSTELKELRNKKEMYINNKNLKKALEYKIKETEYKKSNCIDTKRKKVTIKDIANVISKKTSIPLYEILKDNKCISKIKATLNENIFGQTEAINKLIKIAKRIKYGYKNNNCITILIAGNVGTGKTTLANMFGKEITKETISINMSEYSDETSLSKFIGSNPGYVGYDDNRYVLNLIKDKPNAAIILDEIDKAHPKIINLLSKIFENNTIKDSKNNTINFSNNIIIMTTNKGSKVNNIGFKNNNINKINLTNYFEVSFLNKIDEVITLEPLQKESIIKIINKNLKGIINKYSKVNIKFNKNIINEILEKSNYKLFGANKIEKIINNNIESKIIDSLINKEKNITINWLFKEEMV